MLQPFARPADAFGMQRRRAALPVILVAAATAAMWSALASTTAPAESSSSPAVPVEAAVASSTASPSTRHPMPSDAVIATSVSTTTSSTASVATTAPEPPARELPVPTRVPSDPYEDVPLVELGRIQIPAIGLDHAVYEGVWLTVINEGPGHWPGTPLPGGYGNSVFGGHRVTYTHPFRDLDQLAPGDAIQFTLVDGRRFVYLVTEQFIVEPGALWIVDQAPGRTLTLFACHPKGSARQRIVIRAELAGVVLNPPSG